MALSEARKKYLINQIYSKKKIVDIENWIHKRTIELKRRAENTGQNYYLTQLKNEVISKMNEKSRLEKKNIDHQNELNKG